ncbi:MAG TPA: NPCBM/NEW2 domain-containing protein [Pyrinomonadaceae bacterium]|jgi:predicted O-methyltransferase YrrM|nr:NPCBM/NEW2 domain-containing protein [Pyrinomonadaceae bacterium]
MFLDSLKPLEVQVGYGALGLRGELGYEGKAVSVGRRVYEHALSTHPPARLVFDLGGRFDRFRAHVALNDDVPRGASHADFVVEADGRTVAAARRVKAGEPPRPLEASVAGASRLELSVSTARWHNSHAVWLDPRLVGGEVVAASRAFLPDCLGRVEMELPEQVPSVKRCVATVVSPGFDELLDDMLGSLQAHGNCQDAALVVFAVEADDACRRVARKYGALLVECRRNAVLNPTVKSVLYSAARVVNAESFLCLDADMLVLGDMRPVFAALDACPPGSVLACREANGEGETTLVKALAEVYAGKPADIARINGRARGEGGYALVVNDGLFAASRAALVALDEVIRGWEGARAWVDERADVWWRNQFVFNLALARLGSGVELSGVYNVQLNSQDVEACVSAGRARAVWRGREARVLHFNGAGRRKYPELRGRYSAASEPLRGGGEDAYAVFLEALRGWLGPRGLGALAWSFYGSTDTRTARVADPSTMPLLALLHYVVRAQGCVRVLETGTARGVSAACLASAVAHREGGRVVTFDPSPHADAEELWAALPERMRGCIEHRADDSLAGLRAALDAGESYEAALLDTLHTEEHVWAEFELASKLVCRGGLILIHDVTFAYGTVEAALRRIERAGYGVARLWTAEGGVHEDDRLGLALIENRRRVGGKGKR